MQIFLTRFFLFWLVFMLAIACITFEAKTNVPVRAIGGFVLGWMAVYSAKNYAMKGFEQ